MIKQEKHPLALVILDGFGLAKKTRDNAVAQAKTPNLDYWFEHYPHTSLEAAGTAVGLPPDTIGNSEVGHLTIGSGRIINQDAMRIDTAIADGSLAHNAVLTTALRALAQTDNALHLMGLLSDASVHSNENHLFALLEIAKNCGVKKIFIHPFLDGRDVPPQSAQLYLERLQTECTKIGTGIIGSMIGRFYAMDRDKNWNRTQQCYDMLTQSAPIIFPTWQDALAYYYAREITDEYIPPTLFYAQAIVQPHDGIIFFNFRPDRSRQITDAFVDPTFTEFPTRALDLAFFITPTEYDEKVKTLVLFKRLPVNNTLKEVLDAAGKTMMSIAETEKYAHVTYFFNGGKEKELAHEERVIIPSLRLKNYIEHPEMSARKITDMILHSLKNAPKDFYLINYANADMVGHSGNFTATVKAVECLDHELQKLYEQIVLQMNGTLIITADHGNAEEMFDIASGQPKTSHTTNPVPFIFIQKKAEDSQMQLPLHGLKDIAPFILKQMGLHVPAEMLS